MGEAFTDTACGVAVGQRTVTVAYATEQKRGGSTGYRRGACYKYTSPCDAGGTCAHGRDPLRCLIGMT